MSVALGGADVVGAEWWGHRPIVCVVARTRRLRPSRAWVMEQHGGRGTVGGYVQSLQLRQAGVSATLGSSWVAPYEVDRYVKRIFSTGSEVALVVNSVKLNSKGSLCVMSPKLGLSQRWPQCELRRPCRAELAGGAGAPPSNAA